MNLQPAWTIPRCSALVNAGAPCHTLEPRSTSPVLTKAFFYVFQQTLSNSCTVSVCNYKSIFTTWCINSVSSFLFSLTLTCELPAVWNSDLSVSRLLASLLSLSLSRSLGGLTCMHTRIADKAFYEQPNADVIGYVYVAKPFLSFCFKTLISYIGW